MRGDARLLVIGPPQLRETVARVLPRCRSAVADTLLSGIWTAGHEQFDAVIVAIAAGRDAERAIASLREVAPQTRIVVTCNPAEEPDAQRAIQAGADDYVIEPIERSDLEDALEIAPPPGRFIPAEGIPSLQELMRLGDVLKNLGEGPEATLERLAALLERAFEARGVAISMDELSAVAGEADEPVLEEPIRRRGEVVGRIAVGARRRGSYAAGDAARLGDYAHLIETIVAQASAHVHWKELAWRDDLSGLRNRRYFEARLDELIEQATGDRKRLTVLLFDIDDFKTYNDQFGHDTGDALIREVAMLLTRCSREHDVIARYGGDEFAVILWDAEKPRVPGSQHPSSAVSLADRFRSALGEHDFECLGPDAPGPVTISGGLACFPWDGKTRGEIMRAADEALLAAKRTGKNRIHLADGGREPAADEPDEQPA